MQESAVLAQAFLIFTISNQRRDKKATLDKELSKPLKEKWACQEKVVPSHTRRILKTVRAELSG